MGRKRNNAALILLALPAIALAAGAFDAPVSVPVPRSEHPPLLLAIPTGNLLLHGQYRLSGRFQFFNGSEIGSTDSVFDAKAPGVNQVQNLNYNSELQVGIENRAEIGVQYGQELSLSIKALLVREDLFWPDVVFGARDLFASQEAALYGVTDQGILTDLKSESFVTAAKTFPSKSRLHLGLSLLPRMNDGYASVNAGLEQDLGAGAFLGYEVFERFSDFHQVMTLQWRYRNLVGFSVSMTEFQSWIRQDGRWGFFLTPSGNKSDGYNSPGIAISLQVLGWVPHREQRTLPERVASLEVRNAELEKQLGDMETVKERLAELEARAPGSGSAEQSPMRSAPVPAPPPLTVPQQTVVYLKSIAEKSNSDLTDPKEIRDLMAKVVAMGPEAAQVVKRAALDTAAGAVRVHAVLVMAYSKDSTYATILRALCADDDPRIRREALTALVRLESHGAIEDARRLLSDPDEKVAMTAGEAYRQLKGPVKAKPVAPRKRP